MPVRRFYRICSSDQNRIICAAGALIRGLRGGQDPKAFLYRRQLKFWCPQRSPVSPPFPASSVERIKLQGNHKRVPLASFLLQAAAMSQGGMPD
jgi:hypothetical protein